MELEKSKHQASECFVLTDFAWVMIFEAASCSYLFRNHYEWNQNVKLYSHISFFWVFVPLILIKKILYDQKQNSKHFIAYHGMLLPFLFPKMYVTIRVEEWEKDPAATKVRQGKRWIYYGGRRIINVENKGHAQEIQNVGKSKNQKPARTWNRVRPRKSKKYK